MFRYISIDGREGEVIWTNRQRSLRYPWKILVALSTFKESFTVKPVVVYKKVSPDCPIKRRGLNLI